MFYLHAGVIVTSCESTSNVSQANKYFTGVESVICSISVAIVSVKIQLLWLKNATSKTNYIFE